MTYPDHVPDVTPIAILRLGPPGWHLRPRERVRTTNKAYIFLTPFSRRFRTVLWDRRASLPMAEQRTETSAGRPYPLLRRAPPDPVAALGTVHPCLPGDSARTSKGII